MNGQSINRESVQPLYEQVKKLIYGEIREGNYRPGEIIPAEREFCKKLNVSRNTVRKAISQLVNEGYLYKVQGHGTFVSGDQEKQVDEDLQNKIIGVILADDTEYDSNILKGVEKVASQKNYNVIFASYQNILEKELEIIKKVLRQKVSGLIIMPGSVSAVMQFVSGLKAKDLPFIFVDTRLPDDEIDCVVSSNIKGGYLAAEHLIKLGHKKIAFLKEDISEMTVEDRLSGYKKALKDYDFEIDSDLMLTVSDASSEEKQEEMSVFYNQQKPTAVIAHNDYLALDFYKMCRKNNINIPDDVSLVGYDNIESIKHIDVPLTSIAQFPQEMGMVAAERVLEKIENKNSRKKELKKQIYYPVELVVRQSTAEFES
ncbi:MAG: GntR family transcriptional regulator [Bacillota bacterium]